MRVGVLVEHALARTTSHRLGRPGIVEQLAVGGERLVGVRHDPQLGADVEPALDALVRVGDDRRAGGCELERPAGGRCVDGRVRAARDVQIDPGARDRLSEDVEGHVADHARVPGVAAEVLAAEREVDLGITPARLADELLHPLAPELVAVAVEEDVVLLLDGGRLEQLRVGGPEDRLRAARAELAQAVEPAFGVREHEVVLGRIGAVVVVEARVHAAELRQAHRHVAVVEHDRHVEALAQARRDAAEMRHRHGEDDHRRDVTLLLEDALEMPLPARRDVTPDRLARELVAHRVVRVVLAAAKQRVAFQPGGEPAGAGEELGLAVERDWAPSATRATRSPGRGRA